MPTYYDTRSDVRLIVDPLLLKLREDLMGSGVSFGRIQQSVLPTVVVVNNGNGSGGTEIADLGYIKGITTLSGSTTVATDQKKLAFIGATVTSAGDKTTVTIDTSGGFSNPMTAAGDLITGSTIGDFPVTPAQSFSTSSNSSIAGTGGNQEVVLTGCDLTASDVAGKSVKVVVDVWASVSALGYPKYTTFRIRRTNATGTILAASSALAHSLDSSAGHDVHWSTTYIDNSPTNGHYVVTIQTDGNNNTVWSDSRQMDLYVALSPGQPTRLPIGTSGQVLTVSASGLPSWQTMQHPQLYSWFVLGTLVVGNNVWSVFRIPRTTTIQGAYINVKTVPIGASIIVDIKRSTTGPNGTYTSIFSATPQITATNDSGSSTSLSTTTLNAGDYIRLDITQVGSGVAGADLTVELDTLV